MFSKKLNQKLDKFHLLKHPFYEIFWNEENSQEKLLKIMQSNTINMLKHSQDI